MGLSAETDDLHLEGIENRSRTVLSTGQRLFFNKLWAGHPLNWSPPEPYPFQDSDGSVPEYLNNQCAIKLSISLAEGGLSFDKFPNRVKETEVRRVPDNGKRYRAALRAEVLANWLRKILGAPVVYKNANVNALLHRKGIIFFKDFWTRDGESRSDGDHIDLWDGEKIPNKVSVYTEEFSDPRSGLAWSHYITGAKAVWFWEFT